MIFEFIVIILSVCLCTWAILNLMESCHLGSGAIAFLPLLIIGGPLLGILVGLSYIDYGPRPHIAINVTLH